MGRQYLVEKIHDTFIKTETTTYTDWVSVAGCDRVGLFVVMTKTSSAGNVTLALEGTYDDSTALTLSFQDETGCDVSEAYAATADDHIWLPSGSPVPSKLRASITTAATTNGSNYYTIEIWLVADRI